MHRRLAPSARRLVLLSAAPLLAGGLADAQHARPANGSPGLAPPRTVEPERSVRVAVIGDFGQASPEEAAVAALVHSLAPDLVFTVGDNNYPDGEATTIDANIGQYYHDYIAPYLGSYGAGAPVNRFFPSLGNHDWNTPGAVPYLDYFTLPGNERYYDVRHGPLHVFLVDSDASEPDGIDASSVQAQWLEAAMTSSFAPFKLVLLHHAPYSSSDNHGANLDLQWPYAAWGAQAVLAGHDHLFERFDVEGIAYCVNGLGGNPSIYGFEAEATAGSRSRFRRDHGAQVIDADDHAARMRFVSAAGDVFDDTWLFAPDLKEGPEFLVAQGDTWHYLDDGTDPGASWITLGFDDSSWDSGPSQLGYGDGDEATVVGFGPDPNAKYITTHFRRVFAVADPGSITELRLDVMHDDGVRLLLNGTEVARRNLPAGALTITTPSTTAIGGNPEDSLYEIAVDPGLLVAGNNVLAAEVHQSGGTSSDVSFDLTLQARRDSLALVARGSTWSYLDTGVDPGSAWTEPAFDDSSWATGPAELGYGDGGEATVIGFGGDPMDRHVTTWFRHEFVLANALQWKELLLRLQRDDGAAVYLNGTEVHRYNLPIAAFDATTTAGLDIAASVGEQEFTESRIDHHLLRNGVNVLAVEVHQSGPTSDDLSFDCELFGRR